VKLNCLLAALFLSALFASAGAQSAPIRPGIRQADHVETQTEKNIPPPSIARARIDLVKVGQEADELAKTAQTIPADVASVQNGMLPKNVLQKLRQIEKLSKRMRSELER
jgi:hypothetical protein